MASRHWACQRLAIGVVLVISGFMPALAQSDDLAALNQQIGQLYQAGKYDEAIPLAQRLAELTRTRLGSEHRTHANALGVLGDLYREKGRYAEAEPLYKSARIKLENALGPDHGEVGQSLNRLGLLYWAQGRYAEAEPLYQRALAIDEKVLGPDHPTIGTLLNNLAVLHVRQGRFGEAEPLYERARAIAEKALGPDHPDVGRALTHLALLYANQGRYAEAEPLYKRALAIRERALGPNHPEVAGTLNSLALLYVTRGRYSEAEPLYRRALTIDETALGSEHPNMVSRFNNLADLYRVQGRFAEAEPLYKRALVVAEKALGPNHHHVGSVLNNLAWVYSVQGRPAEAEPLYTSALAIAEQALGPDHPEIGTHLHNLAALFRTQGRLAEAEPLLQRALAIGEKAAPDHPHVAKALNNLAELYRVQGRYADAEALYKRALIIGEKILGPDHPDVGIYLSNFAGLKISQEDWSDAVTMLKRGTDIAIRGTRRTSDGQARTAQTASEARRPSDKLSLLVKAASRLASRQTHREPELAGAMFEAAQWALSSKAADSLSQMAARQAKGDGALAGIVRERQDLVGEWQARDKLLVAAIAQSPDQRNALAELSLRERIAKIDARIAEIDQTLLRGFPEYAALASPEPLSVADVQAQLHANEALVLFLDTVEWKPTPEETFLWVINKTDARWLRIELGTRALSERVAALRCGLDRAAWDDGGATRCARLLNFSAAEASNVLPFDLGRSYELYTTLFAQVEDLIKDKHLLVVPSGTLTSLPFQVLVTEKPIGAGSYADAAWLARHHAITVLPSAASLKALRQFAKASKATLPFVGFGNPLLVGPSGADRSAWTRQSCAKAPGLMRVASRAVRAPTAQFFRGHLANAEFIRRQQPLPETTDELCAVARSVGAVESAIYLGDKATERVIKNLSADGILAQARVVHFATHGLLGSETEMLGVSKAEPALLLTPPNEPSDEDDGLLTASEAALLKLDADWVVLSACNTAAGDGNATGAEALSGLARAFFYAGARALLVSHWAVDSNATVSLITKAFEEIRGDDQVGRAEALRRSMLALIGTGGHNAHPATWAPFVVVGEGAR
jgi:CHAT domain-containing protein/tetratricopeptide (TPR) repeat protein